MLNQALVYLLPLVTVYKFNVGGKYRKKIDIIAGS